VEPGRIDVGIAPGQQYSVAGSHQLADFVLRLIERNPHWLATCQRDRALVLRNGAFAILNVGRVRHRNGNPRRHR
jgi:hypothetical protein